MTARPNQAASLERRDCAPIAFGAFWRGVGEFQRWANLKRIACMLSLLLALIGCGPKTTAEGERIIRSAEECLKHIQAHPPSDASFRLALSDSFTFMGKRDETGAGALVAAELIKRGYLADSKPEQKSGYRLIQFKKTR